MVVGAWSKFGWVSVELLRKGCVMSDPADFEGDELEPEDVLTPFLNRPYLGAVISRRTPQLLMDSCQTQ
jgi:hypothetical protein